MYGSFPRSFVIQTGSHSEFKIISKKKRSKGFSTALSWFRAVVWLRRKPLCLSPLVALSFCFQGGFSTCKQVSFQRHLMQRICRICTPNALQLLTETTTQSNNVSFWQIQTWWWWSVQQHRLHLVQDKTTVLHTMYMSGTKHHFPLQCQTNVK